MDAVTFIANCGGELIDFMDNVALFCQSMLPVLTDDLANQISTRGVDEFYPQMISLASLLITQTASLLMSMGVVRDLAQEELDKETQSAEYEGSETTPS